VIAPRYDRPAASRILADLAQPTLFSAAGPTAGETRRVAYAAHRVEPEPGSHLTLSQRLYLERFMRPCPPELVTTATHRMLWSDSSGVPCAGHYVQGGLGPIVAIAVRETVLALWAALAADRWLAERIAGLGDDDRAVLAGTTTDHDPFEIFRIGVEATGRALAQHALLAGQTPYRRAADFARGMQRSGLFAAVAGQWYWELQASTYRRGMIPARLTTAADGLIHYDGETLDMLRRMKDATMADAHAVMARATGEEGLSVEDAVRRYHDDLDLISRQYALLEPGTRPRCLAQNTILPDMVANFVDTFVRVLNVVEVTERDDQPAAGDGALFHVPDMNCRHCQITIRAVLESMDIDVREVDLVSKRVVAEFRSARNQRRAFDAIRDSGYTVIGGEWPG
jgi:copper chaperone CopZ